MNRLARLALAGCALLVLLGWVSHWYLLWPGRFGVGGVLPSAGVLVLMVLFGAGLLARMSGLGGARGRARLHDLARLRLTARRVAEGDFDVIETADGIAEEELE